MKTKRKTKTILVGIMIICLFVTSVSVRSMPPPEKAEITNITYPEKVREGKIFEITVYFLYENSYCLYGNYIWLIYYYTRTDAIASYHWQKTLDVPIVDSRPSNIPISFNTSILDLEEIGVDVIFSFSIKYNIGYIGSSGNTSLVKTVSTEWYELTILDVRKIGISIIGFVIPLLILSVVVLIRKKGEKN